MISVKRDSPGNVLIKQRRIGLDGKEFTYYKFRTMLMDAPEVGTDAVFNLSDDKRVTRFGRFLRYTALDEIPAIINVIKGDLSLVGPRPSFIYEYKLYNEEQKRRYSVKPGITGYWQTYGRENKIFTLDEINKIDLEYIDKRSLWLDFKILFKTFMMGLKKENAY